MNLLGSYLLKLLKMTLLSMHFSFLVSEQAGLTMGDPSVGFSDARMECNPTVSRKSVVREAIP